MLLGSCKFESTFTMTNVRLMVTCTDGILVSDYGDKYRVTQDAVGLDAWNVEDNRYYAIFDILNKEYDIYLKEIFNSNITEATPYSVEEELPDDPVQIEVGGFSGSYYNIGLLFYRVKNSNHAHPITFRYETELGTLKLYVVHDGNAEDTRTHEKSDLETDFRVFSIPISSLGEFSSAELIVNELNSSNEVVKITYNIY